MSTNQTDSFRTNRIRVRPAGVNADLLMLERGLAIAASPEWQAAHPDPAPQCYDCGQDLVDEDACTHCTRPTPEQVAREAIAALGAVMAAGEDLHEAALELIEATEALLAR